MNIYQLGSMLLSAHMFMPTTSIERNSFLSKNIIVYTMQKHKNDIIMIQQSIHLTLLVH